MLLYTKQNTLVPGYFALDRFVKIAATAMPACSTADYYTVVDGVKSNSPVIDYQFGLLRDDFNFGPVLFFDSAAFKESRRRHRRQYTAAGLYDLRLRISRVAPIVHINEYLYTDVTVATNKAGERIFDYVDPKNRGVQIEMEQACTAHLKEIGGYLEPKFEPIEFNRGDFEYEASVIIPVRNRVRTIRDAIRSVLSRRPTSLQPHHHRQPQHRRHIGSHRRIHLRPARDTHHPGSATTSASAGAGTWAPTIPRPASSACSSTPTTFTPTRTPSPRWCRHSTTTTPPWS